jgi:hypothetical protein
MDLQIIKGVWHDGHHWEGQLWVSVTGGGEEHRQHVCHEGDKQDVHDAGEDNNHSCQLPPPCQVGVTFPDHRTSLCLVMQLVRGGELLGHLRDVGNFEEDKARFYK